MKKAAVLFLRIALITIGLGVLGLLVLIFPAWADAKIAFPDQAYAVYVVLGALYLASIPYFIGIVKAWQLLKLINTGKAFSADSAKVVKAISICAASISAIYIVSMPFFYIWGDYTDAPGLIVIGMVLVGVPLIISVFAALLKLLINEAAELKTENELTV